MSSKRSIVRLLVVLVLLGGAATAVILWAPWAGAGAPTLRYESAKVDRGTIAAKVTATGTLSPRNTVIVGAQVPGRVAEIHADFNDLVKKGQVIAKLDPQLQEAQLAQSNANLMLAKANLADAQAVAREAGRQLARQRSLGASQLNAKAETDAALAKLESARAIVKAREAQVTLAEASVKQNELTLGYTTIFSPVDGTVLSRQIDVGQAVTASLAVQTLFTIAEDLKHMKIDTSVAEGDVGRIAEGLKATFTVDAYPGRTFEGKVLQVRNSPTTVQGIVTYNAVVDVANPDLALRPGMTATVTLVLAETPSTLRIPNAALRFRPPNDVAAAMRGETPKKSNGLIGAIGGPSRSKSGDVADGKKPVWRLENGVPKVVRVKTGMTDGSFTQLLEGDLKEDDALVTDARFAGPEDAAAEGAPRTSGGAR